MQASVQLRICAIATAVAIAAVLEQSSVAMQETPNIKNNQSLDTPRGFGLVVDQIQYSGVVYLSTDAEDSVEVSNDTDSPNAIAPSVLWG